MSATGRGGERVGEDFYPTPAWCTRRILEALPSVTAKRAVWLEPCVGDGAIAEVARAMTVDCYFEAGDIRTDGVWPMGRPGIPFDAWTGHHDIVITNPPFSLAVPLIDHFLPLCDWLILLLRASFKLASGEPGKDGYRNYRNNMPNEYKLPQRPEFVASLSCKTRDDNGKAQPGCGWSYKQPVDAKRPTHCPDCLSDGRRFIQCSTTDASEYSWFVWTPERNRKWGRTFVLPDTSLEERRSDR